MKPSTSQYNNTDQWPVFRIRIRLIRIRIQPKISIRIRIQALSNRFSSLLLLTYNETMLYNNTISKKISILCDNFLTVRYKIKLPRVISSWKSEMKLWLKFQLNQSIFLFLSLKSVIVNFGFLHLFLDTWIQNPDPDSEYGSRIQAQIECGSNRIRNTANGSAV